MSNSSERQVEVHFRFRALPKTPDGILLKFFKKQSAAGFSKPMLLKAARAFWLAEAYQDCGGKQNTELRKLAQNMILVLEDQIAYLRAMFNIERPQQLPIPIYATPPVQVPSPEPEKDSPVEVEDSVWDSVSLLDTGGL